MAISGDKNKHLNVTILDHSFCDYRLSERPLLSALLVEELYSTTYIAIQSGKYNVLYLTKRHAMNS